MPCDCGSGRCSGGGTSGNGFKFVHRVFDTLPDALKAADLSERNVIVGTNKPSGSAGNIPARYIEVISTFVWKYTHEVRSQLDRTSSDEPPGLLGDLAEVTTGCGDKTSRAAVLLPRNANTADQLTKIISEQASQLQGIMLMPSITRQLISNIQMEDIMSLKEKNNQDVPQKLAIAWMGHVSLPER